MHLNPVHQSVKSCVRYLCRALARLQISSLSFALCWTVLNALFTRTAIISCDWHEKSCRIYFHATAFSHAFATFPVFKWCWYSKTFDVFLLQTHDLQNGNVRLQNPTVFCFRSASLCSLCYHVTCLRASQNAMFFHGQALYGLLVNFHYI